MKVAHFDCFSGISGDMVLGALVDLGLPMELLRNALASLQLPIQVESRRVKRNGFAATQVVIQADDQESYRFLADVEALIAGSELTESQRTLARRIFTRLAEAEAAVHGIAIDKVHFHEVGALDSIADILGAAIGLDWLGVERFTSRPVPPGSGTVTCAHGTMPVPTPATALLLRGVPLAAAPVKGELTTPTGAAILTSVVSEYVETPAMAIENIGVGAGSRDPIELPNILRIYRGTATTTASMNPPPSDPPSDTIWVLETNLDDCSPEIVGYATERLFAAGALDVFTQAIQMKKQRPGVLFTVLADDAKRVELETILFQETGTFGIRRHRAERTKLEREAVTVATAWGPIRAKRGWRGNIRLITPEYDDCARVAREQGVPLRAVYAAVCRAGEGLSG